MPTFAHSDWRIFPAIQMKFLIRRVVASAHHAAMSLDHFGRHTITCARKYQSRNIRFRKTATRLCVTTQTRTLHANNSTASTFANPVNPRLLIVSVQSRQPTILLSSPVNKSHLTPPICAPKRNGADTRRCVVRVAITSPIPFRYGRD